MPYVLPYTGMQKTTVYFPLDLKRRLRRLAVRRKTSEAKLVREAVERLTSEERPRPRLPLFDSGLPGIAHRVDEVLAEMRFGEEGLPDRSRHERAARRGRPVRAGARRSS